jgi:hypothetical protein
MTPFDWPHYATKFLLVMKRDIYIGSITPVSLKL